MEVGQDAHDERRVAARLDGHREREDRGREQRLLDTIDERREEFFEVRQQLGGWVLEDAQQRGEHLADVLHRARGALVVQELREHRDMRQQQLRHGRAEERESLQSLAHLAHERARFERVRRRIERVRLAALQQALHELGHELMAHLLSHGRLAQRRRARLALDARRLEHAREQGAEPFASLRAHVSLTVAHACGGGARHHTHEHFATCYAVRRLERRRRVVGIGREPQVAEGLEYELVHLLLLIGPEAQHHAAARVDGAI